MMADLRAEPRLSRLRSDRESLVRKLRRGREGRLVPAPADSSDVVSQAQGFMRASPQAGEVLRGLRKAVFKIIGKITDDVQDGCRLIDRSRIAKTCQIL
jgi:hypothetical protein